MHSNAKDLTGQRFGRLAAVRPTERRQQTFVIWECLCDCGKTHYVTSGNLIHGKVKSCGCVKPNQPKGLTNKQAKDLTGQRFARLVAVRPTEQRENRYIVWECVCDCGNTCFVPSGRLVHGTAKSCGCLRAELIRERTSK